MFFGQMLLILIAAYSGSAIAISYYVAIRRPDRIGLDEFRGRLPQLLQFVYFNPSNPSPYSTFNDRSAADYLLTMKTRPRRILVTWLLHLSVFLGLLGGIAIARAVQYGAVNQGDIISLVLFSLIHARIAFFGSKICAGSSVVFSE